MSMEERFWSKVDKSKPDECWEWQGARVNGYGRINVENKSCIASRIAVKLDNRDPEGKYVCHECDNPPCVNPNHLYLGNQKSNMQDSVKHGNANLGQDGPNAKLTNKQVQDINDKMHEGLSNAEIAEEYPVSAETISDIRCGVSWTHVDVEDSYHKSYEPESSKNKLSVENVRQIKGRLKAGQKPKTIAPKFDVNSSTVSRIKHGYNYEDVEPADVDKEELEFAEKKGHKLTESDVKEIKRKLQEGEMYQKQIAKQYGVSRTLITDISNGKKWSDV